MSLSAPVKGFLSRLFLSLIASTTSLAVHADALPTGGEITAGEGAISSPVSGRMVIDQATDKMSVDWQSFSIGSRNSVTFNQPSASAIALNRVLGSDLSVIQGALNANGHVFLINPNGVLFTSTAQVNVGGIVASTLALRPEDFLADHYAFSGDSLGGILNQAHIQATEGGTIAFIAAQITNTGSSVLVAEKGNVLLGAGSTVTMDLGGTVKLEVEEAAIDALIENGGAIKANGGTVLLTAKAAGDLVTTVINHTGIIEAQTLETGESGTIELLADLQHDRLVVDGVLDASAPKGGKGGFIETSAAQVQILDRAQVNTFSETHDIGTWLIDPTNFTISSGSGGLTTSGIGATTLATNLNSSNVTITTSGSGAEAGDITVSANVAKTGVSATTLTLQAHDDININAAISSNSGRLNVVLNPDNDISGAGSVSFSSSGSITTNGGNFVSGVNSNGEVTTAMGQNFTMASGSYIDTGAGALGINVAGTVTLDAGTLKTSGYGYPFYYNNGSSTYSYNNYINVVGSSIVTNNANASLSDIISSSNVYLTAGAIGSSGTPIKIEGQPLSSGSYYLPYASYPYISLPTVARTLYITNTTGDSYVDHINQQLFLTVSATVGNAASKTQQIRLMGNAGGGSDIREGTGHIILNTDGSGVLALATKDINTSGVLGTYNVSDPSVFPISVTLSAPNITFANNSVNTGITGYYRVYQVGGYTYTNPIYASFSATGSTSLKSAEVDGTADINSLNVSLTGPAIGSATEAIELGSGSSLYFYNTGGSSYIKNVDNSISSVSLTNVNVNGTHSVLFSGGDHINYSTDTNRLYVPTIGASRSDGSDFSQSGVSGIDTSGGNHSMSLNMNTGYIELDTTSVNLGSGSFTASIPNGNTRRSSTKAIFATNAKDGTAEITAGNLSFNVYDNSAIGLISDIEFAKGGSSSSNSLSVYTYGGNVDLTELSTNHLKTLNVTLNGASVAQNVSIALAGSDDVNFSDSGSLVTIDDTKVALSSNNRNWTLSTPSRPIRVNGVSLSSGSYSLSGGTGLTLNSDVLTNGGSISLTGGGSPALQVTKSLRIDSNADDTSNSTSAGAAGSIILQGNMSSTTAGSILTVDSGSSTSSTSGGTIQIMGNASNAGGYYLAGLSVDSRGVTRPYDGPIYWYGSSYLLNGSFSSMGYTLLQNQMTIDTEQGNTNDAGDITFGGYSLNQYYWGTLTLDASTTAAGKNGGNVDLYNTSTHATLDGTGLSITTTGGSGGTSGTIALPAVNSVRNGYANVQSYTGGIITLNGNLSSDRGAITLAGDTRLAANVTIDTWYASNLSQMSQTGTAGAVTISGTGVSGTASGRTLSIDTTTDTSSGYFNPPTNTLNWTHNGGAVSLVAGNAGGYSLGTVTVNTSAAGTHNLGTAGALTLNNVSTTGNQTYTNGATTLSGNVSSSGTIRLNTVTSGASVSGSGTFSAANLLLNGLNTPYTLNTGSGHQVSTLAATGATNFSFLSNETDLTLGTISGISGVSASGTVAIDANGSDITVAQNIATTNTTSSAIRLNAGKDASAGTGSGGNVIISGEPSVTTGSGGRVTFFTGTVSGSVGLTNFIGSGSGNFRYNSDETTINYTTALGSGSYAIYRQQPIITVTAQDDSKTYNGVAYSGGNGVVNAGFVNEDSASIFSGSLSYGGTAQGAINAASYSITPSGYSNGLGYGFSFVDGALLVTSRDVTVTADPQRKTVGQVDPAFTYMAQAQSGSEGLITGQSLSGTLSRVIGETAGAYSITQGTVTHGNNPNYYISYLGDYLTIIPLPIVAVTLPPVQAAVSGTQIALHTLVSAPTSPLVLAPMTPPSSGISQNYTVSGLSFVPIQSHAPIETNTSGISPGGTVALDNTVIKTYIVAQSGTSSSGMMQVFVVNGGVNLTVSLNPNENER